MICPIKSEAFRHEESFESTPGASKYHCRFLTPSGTNVGNMLPRSKDAEFYAGFESDVGLSLHCLFDYLLDKIFFGIFTFSFCSLVPFVTLVPLSLTLLEP